MISPFKYTGNKSEAQIIECYKSGIQFGLKQLTETKLFNEALEDQDIDD